MNEYYKAYDYLHSFNFTGNKSFTYLLTYL